MNRLTLLLYLLIIVALSKLDRATKKIYYFTVDEQDRPLNMSWKEAKEQCKSQDQKMLRLNAESTSTLRGVISNNMHVMWLSLLRDAENDSAWRWVNPKGVADSEDVSQRLDWANKAQSSHCGFLYSNSTWSSKRCEQKSYFFCSTDRVRSIKTKLSWYDARKYCQNNMSDLLTVPEETEKFSNDSGWMGLYRLGGETWQWVTGQSVGYTAWRQGEPVTNDCAALDVDAEKWESYPCNTPLNFLCYTDNLVIVHENKTWEQALEHCRNFNKKCSNLSCASRYRLLSLDSSSEYSYVRDQIYGATTNEVWIGLRFLGGEWWSVSGDQVNDDGTLLKCPELNHCGVISKTDDTRWITRNCSERLNFVCYKQT